MSLFFLLSDCCFPLNEFNKIVVVGKRDKLCTELLTSEKAHVQALNALFENYVQPLRDGTILPTNIFQEIFSNLELIRSWHATFYEGLNTHLACGDTFGDFFMDMVLSPRLIESISQQSSRFLEKDTSFETALHAIQREL